MASASDWKFGRLSYKVLTKAAVCIWAAGCIVIVDFCSVQYQGKWYKILYRVRSLKKKQIVLYLFVWMLLWLSIVHLKISMKY